MIILYSTITVTSYTSELDEAPLTPCLFEVAPSTIDKPYAFPTLLLSPSICDKASGSPDLPLI